MDTVFTGADRTDGLDRGALRIAGQPYTEYVAELAMQEALFVHTPVACFGSILAA